MASFSIDQAIAVTSVQQLIHDWAHDLDIHNGTHVAGLVTEDCSYNVGGAVRNGRSAVEQFYRDRQARLSAQPEGVPTHRHVLSNLRVDFRSDEEVSITFGLLYFTTAGVAAGTEHADPAAVADVRMACRRGADGQWRISEFDSNQTFRRPPPAPVR